MNSDFQTIRETLDLTQAQAAEWVCVSQATVSRWERGARKTPKWALKLLALKNVVV